MDELRQVAEQLAGEAAEFVRRRRREVFAGGAPTAAVRVKSTPTDPVTVVDTETEELVRRRLAELLLERALTAIAEREAAHG